jgi:hypothetical protein
MAAAPPKGFDSKKIAVDDTIAFSAPMSGTVKAINEDGTLVVKPGKPLLDTNGGSTVPLAPGLCQKWTAPS